MEDEQYIRTYVKWRLPNQRSLLNAILRQFRGYILTAFYCERRSSYDGIGYREYWLVTLHWLRNWE